MAKRKKKKKKNATTKHEHFFTELNGVLMAALAVIGIGRLGFIGKIVSGFSIYLVGDFGDVLLIFVILIGLYMLIKRSWPNFKDAQLIGLYMIFLTSLVFAQLLYLNDSGILAGVAFDSSLTNFVECMKNGSIVEGGGLIGSGLTALFVKLFDLIGTRIIISIFALFGFILLTGVSLLDIIKYPLNKAKGVTLPKREKRIKEEIAEAEEKFEKETQIVISSVDELNELTNEESSKEEIPPKNIEQTRATIKDNELKINAAKEDLPVKPLEEEIVINNAGYKLPSITLLDLPKRNQVNHDEKQIKENGRILVEVFKNFGVEGKVVAANIGPTITQYEMQLKAGTKLSKVVSIHKEIALELAAKNVRIQAPIPGKRTIGVEIPNKIAQSVTMREILERVPKKRDIDKLLVTLGKDIMGNPTYAEINKTPHLLVAGATGSGKSVCINTIITSILMRTKPDEVRLLMVDPKKVELNVYNGIPHLLAPVVTDPKKASIALQKIVTEMENRYDLFSDSGTKNIAGYNKYIDAKNEQNGPDEQIANLPFIVVIIDELADLMMVASKEVEDSIMRITQMARAAGIHLIIATQRPSTDIITGVIKANIPSRISFAVSSSIDSRTILDMTGAEKLLGKGDMLFLPMGESVPIRVQGAYISEEEIKKIVDYTISQQKAKYDDSLTKLDENKGSSFVDENDYEDPLYNEIVEFVIKGQKASASLLQRRFHFGYNRAARVVDLLEDRGIIGGPNGSKPREVLVKFEDEQEE